MDVLNAKSVITAPLSTKRSWRAESEDFDNVYKNCCSFGCFNSSPVGELLFITKKRSGFCVCLVTRSVIYRFSFDKEKLARSV